MVKLISDNFTLDIQFANYSKGVVDYHIQFEYAKRALFNSLITNKKYFTIQESRGNLISILEKALKITIEEFLEYWEETLDYINVVWLPNSYTALIVRPCFHLGLKDMDDQQKIPAGEQQRLRAIDEMREAGLQFSEDTFILEFWIEVEGLKNPRNKAIKFRGNAISAVVMAKRPALEEFLSELQEEYANFCKKFKVNDLGKKVQEFLDGKSKPEEMSDLEKEFDQEMRKIYWNAKKYGMNGDAFIGLIEEHGGRKSAKILLGGSDSVSGATKLRFMQIVKGRGLDLTVEHLVAQPKWSSLFTKKEIKIAKNRLEEWK